MTRDNQQALDDLKRSIRQRATANRQAQADKDRLSERICQAVAELPEYLAARTVLFYIDARSEVRTRSLLLMGLKGEKQIVVPYCSAGRLELFHLESMEELTPGSYQILEPRPELRLQANKQVDIRQLDLALIPGVAFDAKGGRLGHGLGYYDKLLADAPHSVARVALAFECQLFPELPTVDHDVPMDVIVTERSIYRIARQPGDR